MVNLEDCGQFRPRFLRCAGNWFVETGRGNGSDGHKRSQQQQETATTQQINPMNSDRHNLDIMNRAN